MEGSPKELQIVAKGAWISVVPDDVEHHKMYRLVEVSTSSPDTTASIEGARVHHKIREAIQNSDGGLVMLP